jgi:hypothetical protein
MAFFYLFIIFSICRISKSITVYEVGRVLFTLPALAELRPGFIHLFLTKKNWPGPTHTQPVFIIIMTMITIMFRFRLRYDYGFDFGYVIVPKNYVLVPKHYVNFVSFLRGIFRCNPGSLNRLKIRINKKNK